MAETNEANSESLSTAAAIEGMLAGPSLNEDNLEDLFSVLNQKIHSSNWLQENTPEKFEAENPEVAKMFRELREKEKQKQSENEEQKQSASEKQKDSEKEQGSSV